MTEHRRTRLLTIVAALTGLAAVAWAGYTVLGSSGPDRQSDLLGKGRGEIAMPTSTHTPSPVNRPGHHRPDVTGAGRTVLHPRYPRDDQPARSRPPQPGDPAGKDFTVVVGSVSGLYPGSANALPLTYVNSHHFAIRIGRVTVSASGSTSCPAWAFETGQYQLADPVVVLGRSTASSSVAFGMRKSAPDGCQQARVAVTVSATATATP